MRYAKHIGRVGGLAVALGVGLGFGPVHGLPVAYATEPGADSSSSNGSSPSQDQTADTTGPTGTGTQTPSSGTPAGGATDGDGKDGSADSQDGGVATNPGGSSTGDHSDTGEIGAGDSGTTGSGTKGTDASKADDVLKGSKGGTNKNNGTDSSKGSSLATDKPQSHIPALSGLATASTDDPPTARIKTVEGGVRAADDFATADIGGTNKSGQKITAGTGQSFSAFSTAAVNAPAATPEPATVVSQVISGLLSAIGLGPSATQTPLGAPTESPFSWGLLAWVRRSFQDVVSGAGTAQPQQVTTGQTVADASPTLRVAALAATNTPPVAVNDTYTVVAGNWLNVPAATGVLANDTDANGDTLQAISATQPAHGMMFGSADGAFFYGANAGFLGTDTFNYTISDGKGGTATATVTIKVVSAANKPPVASNGTVTTNEDTAKTGTLSASDPDGQALTYAITQQPTKGVISNFNTSTGSYTYTPNANVNGTDTIKFTASDGSATSNVGTVTITITPVNDAPVASNGTVTTAQGTAVSGTLPATDIDSGALTYAITQQPTKGTISNFNSSTGAYTYTPGAGLSGTDTIKFTASDGSITSNVGTVTITITATNRAPVANNSTVTTNEDTATSGALSATDPDGQAVSYTITQQPTKGVISNFNSTTGTYTYTPNANANGADSIKFTASDGSATSNVGTVSITINPVNDAPVANNGGVITNEDTAFTGTLPASDVDGQALTYTITQQPTKGVISNFNSTTGSYTYTPNANVNGTDTIKFIASDGSITSNVGTVTVTINAVNDAPVANNGTLTTNEDTATTGTLTGSDVEGQALTYTITQQPTKGVISNFNSTTGTYTYTPNANANGADTIKFTASDGSATSNVGTVTVTINPVNDAPVANNGTLTTNEDTATTGTLGATDVDGQALTYTITQQPTKGVISNFNSTTGTYTYTPNANANGTDTINFIASDGSLTSNIGTVTVTITAVNDAPVANNGTLTTNEDTATTGTLTGSDVEGQALTYTITQQPTNGTISGFNSATGAYTYTPNANYNGTDTIKFTASDGSATSNVGTVTVTINPVNDAPVANNGTLTTNEDTATAGTLGATDVDGQALTYTITQQPTKGVISNFNSTTGTYTYTPNANANGTDTIKFTASDGSATSNVGTVTVTITPVNDAPVANNSTLTTNEDTPTTGTLGATDVDGQSLTYTITQNPTNGTISGFNSATGAYTYTPNANYNGTDTIKFTASDGSITSNVGTISVTVTAVNDAPVANNGTLTTAQGTAVNGTLGATDIDSGALTYTITQNPTNGTISNFNSTTGAYTYTPGAGFNGTDTVKFTASDGSATSNVGTITITVTAANTAPVAGNGTLITNEDTAKSGTLSATDVDGQSLTYTITQNPTNGTISGFNSATGAYTYTPNANYNGTDTIKFTASDGSATSNVGTISVTVTAVNDAPVANNGTLTTNEDTATTGTLAATDVDSTGLTYTITQQPTKGVISNFNSSTGAYTYTPNANANGTDTIKFTASDGSATSNVGTVTVTITAVNDAPVASNGTLSTNEDTATTGTLPASDVDGQSLTYSITQQPTKGVISNFNSSTGAYTYTPNANVNGTDTIKFTASDGSITSNVGTVTVTINAVNDAPVAGGGSVSTAAGTAISSMLPATDVDSTALTYTITQQPTNGTISGFNSATGAYTYTPGASFNGTDTIKYTVSDGSLTSNVGTVTITVAAPNNPPLAPGGTLTTNEDTAKSSTLPGSDPEGQPLTYTITQQPTRGTISNFNAATGTYTYTPSPNYNGTDTIQYTVSDGTHTTDPATISITVTAVNDAPVAVSDTYTAVSGQWLSAPAPVGVLVNDIDVDGDPLTAISATQPANGQLLGYGDGGFFYQSKAGFTGADTFTYTVSDGKGGTAVGTVTINVVAANNPPVAPGGTITTNEDTATSGTLPASDPEGQTLVYSITTPPTNGTISNFNSTTGAYTYTPNANFNGVDTIRYTASDGIATSSVGTVTINVTAVNDPPVANGGVVNTGSGVAVNSLLPATDPDGQTLTFTITQQPSNGTISNFNSTTGAYTYTPGATFNGVDTIKYTVSDGIVTSNVGTVTFNVSSTSQAPVIRNLSSSAADPSTGGITFTAQVDAGNTLTVTQPSGLTGTVSQPTSTTSGSLTSYTFTYTPTDLARINAGSTLPHDFDSFTVTVSNGVQTTTSAVDVEVYSGAMLTGQNTTITGWIPSGMTTNGTKLYVANLWGNNVSVIDTNTGQTITTIATQQSPSRLAVSPDGTKLYVTSTATNTVVAYNTSTGSSLGSANVPVPQGVAVSPDGTRVYVTSGTGNNVTILNAATMATVGSFATGSDPVGITISPDGQRVYVVNRGSGTVTSYSVSTNTSTSFAVGSRPQQVAVSPNGQRLYVTNTNSGTVSVLNASTGATLATVAVGQAPNGITISPDGSLAYVTLGDNKVVAIDTKNNTKVTGTIQAETGSDSMVAISTDGNKLFVGNSSGFTLRTVTLTHLSDPPPTTANPNAGPMFEDFNGVAGSAPNPNLMHYLVGAGGGGQQQIYTSNPANGSLDGNGNLVITALKQTVQDPYGGTWYYTSAGFSTQDQFEFTYGTLEARIQFPQGQALWPVFWTLGSDIDTVGWPNAGEVDIMELFSSPGNSGTSIHGPGEYGVSVPAPIDITDGFHTYWMKWEPNKITVGIDTTTTAVFTPDSLPPGVPWTFNDRSQYAILNLMVGGPFGQPDSTTPFPTSMIVDYIKYTPLST